MQNTLKMLRELKGLKQSAVASRLGISQSAYSKLERGITRMTQQQAIILERELEFDPSQTAENSKPDKPLEKLFLRLFTIYRNQIDYLTEENETLRRQINTLLQSGARPVQGSEIHKKSG